MLTTIKPMTTLRSSARALLPLTTYKKMAQQAHAHYNQAHDQPSIICTCAAPTHHVQKMAEQAHAHSNQAHDHPTVPVTAVGLVCQPPV